MALSLTYRTSGETEDPLVLLVNSEQHESERISDVSVCDITSPGASPPPSSKVARKKVRDTLENHSTSSQETSSSISSPLNDPEPEVMSTKAAPAGVESRNSQSDSGNHQQSLQREYAAFRKARKHLSQMFSAVCKALPNPFTCMSPPS
ncbi:hypothetical protein AOLI_G00137760 [Acnodon oligacanthus]